MADRDAGMTLFLSFTFAKALFNREGPPQKIRMEGAKIINNEQGIVNNARVGLLCSAHYSFFIINYSLPFSTLSRRQ
jgi:hypothetical protein